MLYAVIGKSFVRRHIQSVFHPQDNHTIDFRSNICRYVVIQSLDAFIRIKD